MSARPRAATASRKTEVCVKELRDVLLVGIRERRHIQYKQEFAGIVDLAAPPPPAEAEPAPEPPPIVAAESWVRQAPRTPVARVRPLYLLEAHAETPAELELSLTSKSIRRVAFLQEHWQLPDGSKPRVDQYYNWYETFMIPKSIDVEIYGIGKRKPWDFIPPLDEQYVAEFEEMLPRLTDYDAIVVNTGHSYAIGAFVARNKLGFEIIDMMRHQEYSVRERHIKYKQELAGVVDKVEEVDAASSVGIWRAISLFKSH